MSNIPNGFPTLTELQVAVVAVEVATGRLVNLHGNRFMTNEFAWRVFQNIAEARAFIAGALAYCSFFEFAIYDASGQLVITIQPDPSSRLFYHGSRIEVELGDKVRLTRWLRGSVEGSVSYIPGVSKLDSKWENDGVKRWTVTTKDCTVIPILYDPTHAQPKRNIEFISRGSFPSTGIR